MFHILIIDGDTAVGTAIKLWLEVEGADVVHIADGPGGIEALRNGQFDLAIIELSMPGFNGLETIQTAHRIQPATPIIVLSNVLYRSERMMSEAIALGATCVLAKPFKPRNLMQAIESAVGRSFGPPPALRPDQN
ncbi:MAG TPA: response regulator [Xanthobacteraceae bacterium]|nr:response regulator [Xanthobacteraceae bacterium]